jgi:hypothetical protein
MIRLVPPRPPPQPPTLTVLCIFAAAIMTWGAASLDLLARAGAGLLAGIPFTGAGISAEAPWLAIAEQGPAPEVGSGAMALVLLSGCAAVPAVTALLHGMADLVRTSGVTRALALEGFVVGLLWFPTALAAAAAPGGAGPVSTLYGRLGDPQAGRWAAALLALLLALLVAGPASRRTVAVGRAWIRADSPDFRRRLVRLVAGYPAALSICALMITAGWAPPPLALGWAVVILVTLRIRTQ